LKAFLAGASSNRGWVVEIVVAYLQFSRCHIFVSFISSALIARCNDTAFWISAGTIKDDLQCPVQVKMCFTDVYVVDFGADRAWLDEHGP